MADDMNPNADDTPIAENWPDGEDGAEKAYAAAAESIVDKPEVAAEPTPAAEPEAPPAETSAEAEAPPPETITAPVEFPARAQRATKPVAAEIAPAIETPIVVAAPPALPKPRKPITQPAGAKPAKRPAAIKAVPVRKARPIAAKLPSKPAKPGISASVKTAPVPPIKEKLMDKTSDFVDGVQKVAADTQAKAKQAFEKGSAMFGEYAEFAKGNVEAFVESGKILATGLQGMGSSMVAEGKTAFETATSDVKQLAAVKSPGEFLKLHTDILRRNFDSAVKLTTKNGEAMMKLATDSFAPISGRVTLAVEKLKAA